MSGHSQEDAISFLNDEDDDPATYALDEVDVHQYGDDAEVEDDAPIDDDGEAFSIVDNLPPEFVAPLDEFEIPKFSLKCGDIQPGSIVELEDESGRDINHLTSGDFLLVRSIIENVKYGEISLRGYRMRRCKYVRPMFDNKLNDVFMMLQVDEHDRRPRFVQGLEDVTPAQVKQIRKCVFTHLHSSIWNSGHVNTHVPARLQTQNQLKEWIFKYGTLICRYVYVVETHPKGQSYGGESRLMYKREVRSFTENFPISSSSPPTKRAPARPNKGKVLTFGDAFCGVGGTSQGARGAGYKVLWGLENSRDAMEGHRKNFPEAQHLEMDAHDFPSIARRCVHGCDHLHMSCPCCYWSENHTVEGKNDEANKLTLYTVEPTLAKVKPTTFSLEQAPGLLKLAKHRMYFRNLINGILTAGYRVRWRIQDQAWFGLGQHRRRLIFVGAKIGIPLPPFPAPIHGPARSGLKRFVTIGDSLRIIERQPMSFRNDPYHQPQRELRLQKPALDPHVNLAKCITTSGGDNVHYSGTRKNTVRELSLLQGFPQDFHFTGSNTQAKMQCGNAWAPSASKVYFAVWAAHREAFDNGFIEDEDEVLDLYQFLEDKGDFIPGPPVIDLDHPQTHRDNSPKYRYLHRIEKNVRPNFPLPLWGKHKSMEPAPQVKRRMARTSNLLNGSLDNSDNAARSGRRRNITGRKRRRTAVWIDDDEEPTWISEEE